MSGLKSISILVEEPPRSQEWGNALPILHEIRHGLERLVSTGEPSLIDLRAIPFGPGDEARLLALLGRGEVEAVVNALGETRIQETAIPGVWLIDHYNAQEERIALHLEIDRIPGILLTQAEDLAEAGPRLELILAGLGQEGGWTAMAQGGEAPPPLGASQRDDRREGG